MANLVRPLRTVCGVLAVLSGCAPALAQCPAPTSNGFAVAAKAQFDCSSALPLKDPSHAEREFKARYEFPSLKPQSSDLPWKGIDFKSRPEEYLLALLAYGLKDNASVDFRIEDNNKSLWCHVPWFHNLREQLHGMTNERGSRAKELHKLQVSRARNWAIGFYNDIGCHAIGTVWKDAAFPKTKGFAFADGSYTIKLLFTTASLSQVPYLTGSKTWNAAINDDGSIVQMRLLQVDVAVRDTSADSYSGWVFGTFIYDAYAPGETVWEKLVPVGLMWGNDPNLTTGAYEQDGKFPLEGWINENAAKKFYHLPRHNLGLHGRVNGPVDNPRAACLACHGRALDWGRATPRGTPVGEEANLLLPLAPNPLDDAAVKNYFRNLKPDQPFIEGTQSLDFSLQLAGGISNFRSWVVASFPDQADKTSDVPRFKFKADQPSPGAATAPYLLQLRRAAGALPSHSAPSPFMRGED